MMKLFGSIIIILLRKKSGNFFCSKNRENILNNTYYYPIIVSNINNNFIYSISPIYYNELKAKLEDKNLFSTEELIYFLESFFKDKLHNFKIKEMYRMTLVNKSNIEISNVIEITDKYKKEFFNSFNKNKDESFKEKRWNELINNKYINGVLKDESIASMGYISNIENYGANIIIQTKDTYKNNGYAKSIVAKICNDVLENNLIPIYWVETNNIPSINLAKSLGFKTMVKEIVVSVNI